MKLLCCFPLALLERRRERSGRGGEGEGSQELLYCDSWLRFRDDGGASRSRRLLSDREFGESMGGEVGELEDGPRNPRSIDEHGALFGLNYCGPLRPFGGGESGAVFVVHGLEKGEGPAGLHPVLVPIPDKELFTWLDGASGDNRDSSFYDNKLAVFLMFVGCFIDAATGDAIHFEGVCVDK
jgi:hypothetical protein